MIILTGAVVVLVMFKQYVQENRNILNKLNKQVLEEQEAIALLEVELEYLSRPQRLKMIVDKLGNMEYPDAEKIQVIKTTDL